ncbi:MAG: nucleoside triphosphate pyrophosphohydrolase family protein [Candidatus Micrarchaeia archaeon]
MNLSEYQEKAHSTAIYPSELDGAYFYPAIGLAGEVGELLNKIKKIARDNASLNKEDVKLELGDILWYLSELAGSFGISMDNVAEANLEKLARRKSNGTLRGSGDQR